jgi:hypothetical protein
MRWTREYKGIWLKPEAIRKVYRFFETSLLTDFHRRYEVKDLSTELSGALWEHASDEDFFAAYRPGLCNATYKKAFLDYEFMIRVVGKVTFVGVKARNRKEIEAVFETLERIIPQFSFGSSDVIESWYPLVLVGHGPAGPWKDLAFYLLVQQGYGVRVYEISGEEKDDTQQTLEGLDVRSCFGIVLVSNQDLEDQNDGPFLESAMRHLTVLQARLRPSRTLLLAEDGAVAPPEVQGRRSIIYRKGSIKEAFWEILRLLQNELGKWPHVD